MWQPQFWSHVNKGVYGWGSVMSNKNAAGGYEWAHISVPFPTYINSVAQYIMFVQFCAEADHPTRTKPTKLDLWADTKFFSSPIVWPNSTARQCIGVSFSPAIWKESLGLSVLVSITMVPIKSPLIKPGSKFRTHRRSWKFDPPSKLMGDFFCEV